jgi:cilia- and flagella-associated protein 65
MLSRKTPLEKEQDITPSLEPTRKLANSFSSKWKTKLGIDCAESVHFSHWYLLLTREPGGEYVKHLIIKNVVMKTQKIKYRLPQTRYFSMEFPETQTLSAGMNWTIPITFRPVAKESYDDVVEFVSSFGTFKIPITATLPAYVVDFPSEVDFGYSPINETAKFNFTLSNIGELPSKYEWNVEEPFFITPKSGELSPGTNCQILVEFNPKEATAIEALALCSFGSQDHWEKTKVVKTARIKGISKYSHLICESSEPIFNFGKVFVGTSTEKKLVLKNPSPVHANFKIKKSRGDSDDFFSFSIISGRLEAGAKMEIGIKYTPIVSGLFSNTFFDVCTMSGNTIRLALSGEGVGPSVSLEPSVLNFNDIPARTAITKVFHLKNESVVPASFQFNIDKTSSFQLDKLCGTINPNSVIPIQVKICPTEPMNYYRKVFCLVENQETIAIEFLATCYNEKRRPATFKYHHVENYQRRIQNGLWEYGPEQLEVMIKSETIQCVNGVLEYANPQLALQNELSLKKDDPYSQGVNSSEYFFENAGDNLACVLLDTYVDFGSCSRYSRCANHSNPKPNKGKNDMRVD